MKSKDLLSLLYENNPYCQKAGVTGLNNGSWDDSPYLLKAYLAAVADGAKFLVLPLGFVYVNARTIDQNYPFDYVVRVAGDDFLIIAPSGCVIVDTNTSNPGGRGFNDIFQFTGNRSGITGGGRFVHATPGVTASVANNFSTAVHLSSASDQCFIENLSAEGLCCTTQGVFDDSSANRARMRNLRVSNCVKGVVQSSTASTVKCDIEDIFVNDYTPVTGQGGYGIGINGADVSIGGLIHIRQSYSGALGSTAIACDSSSIIERITAGGATIRIDGPGSGIASQYGIFMSGANWSATKTIEFGAININGMSNPLALYGVRKNVHMARFVAEDATFPVYRASDGTHNQTGDLIIDSIDISNAYQAFTAADANQSGRIILGNGTIATRNDSSGLLFDANTTTVYPLGNVKTITIASNVSTTKAVPLINRGDIQRVASAANVTATAGINGLETQLTGTTATTLASPATPFDGQVWEVAAGGAAVTLSPTAPATVIAGTTALAAGGRRKMRYDSATTTWV